MAAAAAAVDVVAAVVGGGGTVGRWKCAGLYFASRLGGHLK